MNSGYAKGCGKRCCIRQSESTLRKTGRAVSCIICKVVALAKIVVVEVSRSSLWRKAKAGAGSLHSCPMIDDLGHSHISMPPISFSLVLNLNIYGPQLFATSFAHTSRTDTVRCDCAH